MLYYLNTRKLFSILFNVNYLKIGKKKELCHLFKCKYWSEYQLSVADWSIWWWFIRFECIIYQLQNLKIRKIKFQYLPFDKKGFVILFKKIIMVAFNKWFFKYADILIKRMYSMCLKRLSPNYLNVIWYLILEFAIQAPDDKT